MFQKEKHRVRSPGPPKRKRFSLSVDYETKKKTKNHMKHFKKGLVGCTELKTHGARLSICVQFQGHLDGRKDMHNNKHTPTRYPHLAFQITTHIVLLTSCQWC